MDRSPKGRNSRSQREAEEEEEEAPHDNEQSGSDEDEEGDDDMHGEASRNLSSATSALQGLLKKVCAGLLPPHPSPPHPLCSLLPPKAPFVT